MNLVTGRWSMPGVEDPPDASVTGTPARRPASVRRTTHLTATFPDGPAVPGTWGTTTRLVGAARDLLTRADGGAEVLEQVRVQLDLTAGREVSSAVSEPPHPGVSSLAGISAGRGFRAATAATLGAETERGAALCFLLDDVSVVSGICGTAWSQHRPLEIPKELLERKGGATFQRTSTGRVACSGLRPGGYHEQSWEHAVGFPHWIREAGDLTDTPDPLAWHEIEEAADVCFRRRRRIDVARDGARLDVDVHYRDSIYGTGRVEVALHEYSVRASVDAVSGELLAIVAEGNVLPFPECPWAAPHVDKLVGQPVSELRTSVPETLAELEACSHLNDVLRGLADVPAMARGLDGRD